MEAERRDGEPAEKPNIFNRAKGHADVADVGDGKMSEVLAGDPYLTPVCCSLLHTSKHHHLRAFP